MMINGQLAFRPTGTNEWSGPECVKTIDVISLDADSEGPERWQWRQGSINGPCRNQFPIFYGATFIADAGKAGSLDSIPAKPLKQDVTYEVNILSPGSAYGAGRFRLDGPGQVENLP